jgi:hypothetical protein
LVAAAILCFAVSIDAGGTAANVVADVFLASTLTLCVRAYVLSRNRKRYASEVRHAQQPLREQLVALRSYLSDMDLRAAKLAIPAGPYDWADFLPGGDRFDPYGSLRPDRPDFEVRPRTVGEEATLPTSEAHLLATFDALQSGYPGPDLKSDLVSITRTAEAVPSAWREFAERYNAMEALAPAPLMPGMPVDPYVMREVREAEEAKYRLAAEPVQAAAKRLHQIHAAVDEELDRLWQSLDGGYDPDILARRNTQAPFPLWVVRCGIAAAAASFAIWCTLFLTDHLASSLIDVRMREEAKALALDIADNVVVGVAATVAGLGLALITSEISSRRLAQEAREPYAELFAAAAVLEAAKHPSEIEVAAATSDLRNVRDRLRRAIHRLQHIAPNPRLDTYGDRVIDLIDEWINSPSPSAVLRLRMRAALTQLRALVDAQFPVRHLR